MKHQTTLAKSWALLLADEIELGDKEGKFILIKGTIHQKDIIEGENPMCLKKQNFKIHRKIITKKIYNFTI
jgi:hypothetical protein